MFDFFDEFFGEIKKGAYRYQVDSGRQIAIEGYKNVLRIDENSIVVKIDNGEIEVLGQNLKVKELSTNTIVVYGKIQSISEVCKWKITIKLCTLFLGV